MDVSNVAVAAYDTPSVQVADAPAVQAADMPSVKSAVESAKPAIQTGLDSSIEKLNKQHGIVPQDTLDKAIEKINRSLVSFNREMKVSVHSRLNRIMVKVIDTEQNKVIREIPPEKVLDAFAKALEMAGVLFDEKR